MMSRMEIKLNEKVRHDDLFKDTLVKRKDLLSSVVVVANTFESQIKSYLGTKEDLAFLNTV